MTEPSTALVSTFTHHSAIALHSPLFVKEAGGTTTSPSSVLPLGPSWGGPLLGFCINPTFPIPSVPDGSRPLGVPLFLTKTWCALQLSVLQASHTQKKRVMVIQQQWSHSLWTPIMTPLLQWAKPMQVMPLDLFFFEGGAYFHMERISYFTGKDLLPYGLRSSR